MVDIDYAALTNALVDVIPADVFLWIKFALMAMVVLFIVGILKSILQMGTAYRIRKILKVVSNTNTKLDSFIRSYAVAPEEEQTAEYSYQ